MTKVRRAKTWHGAADINYFWWSAAADFGPDSSTTLFFYIKAAALNKSDSLEGRMKVSSLNSKSGPGGFSKMFTKSFEDHDTNFPTLIQLRGNIFLSRKSIILIKCKLVIIMVSVVQSGLRCMLIMSVHCYLLWPFSTNLTLNTAVVESQHSKMAGKDKM